MPADTESANPEHNIAMWGAPGSGKTTFLAALNIALTRSRGAWKVVGADDTATDFLIEKTAALSDQKRFPVATEGLESYRWLLMGRPDQDAGRRRRRRESRVRRIGLDMLDPPGGFYGGKRVGHGTEREDLLDNLIRSRGIVFLFDPVRESKEGDAFGYLYGALAQLAQRMLGTDDFRDGRLPHHLAVCITKFDEMRVLQSAEKLGLVTPDPDDRHGFPRIDDGEDARELFSELCSVSASGNAEMVLNTLEQYFHPERIEFFATSSIGFYLDPRKGAFDRDDFQNLIPEPVGGGSGGAPEGTRFRIRGQVRPINVMEPMLWLGQRLATEAGGR